MPFKRWHLRLALPNGVKDSLIKQWEDIDIASIDKKYLETGKSIYAYLHLKHADETNILAKRKAEMNQYSSRMMSTDSFAGNIYRGCWCAVVIN